MQLTDHSLLRNQCYVNGKWLGDERGRSSEVHNPASGELIGTVPQLDGAATRAAIDAAAAAFPAWAARTAGARAQILRRWFELTMANQKDLATLMTAEQGKPLAEAMGEIAYAAAFVEWFAEEGRRLYGEIIPGHQADKRILVLRQPVGVVAAITPWNFPAAMITRKAAPALAAGCTIVVKPAGQTPLSARAASSAIASADSGVCPAGLTMNVQPAASAGAALRVIIAAGKFHGVIAATTPTGCRITTMRLSA